jgi:HK97 family phage portal protein
VSLLFRGRSAQRFQSMSDIPPNSQVGRFTAGHTTVTADTALRSSAVWAALRLRANLISTLPVESYRMAKGVRIDIDPPAVTFLNAGAEIPWNEFLYATQMDLDRSGNAFGVITQRNALGLPTVIELVNLSEVRCSPRNVGPRQWDSDYVWRISGIEYPYKDLWHERQYVISGIPMGLNAVGYAAYAVGTYLTAQDFAIKWFGNDALPAAVLKNEEEVVPKNVADAAKAQYQASMTPGGVFVTGRDWSLSPLDAATNSTNYIETMQNSIGDIARYFDVPVDLIDGSVSGSGSSVKYANITQRFLQLLVVHLGPSITRRELALSNLSSAPRFVKLNRKALLAMDPLTQAQLLTLEIASKYTTPDEARALMDKAPLTEEEKTLFNDLFGNKNPPPPAPGQDSNTTDGVPA